MKKTLLFYACICFSFMASAQATWVGGSSGNWNTPANWSTSLVPNLNTDVILLASATVTIDSDVAAKSITFTGTNPTAVDNIILSANLNLTNASQLGRLKWLSGTISGGATIGALIYFSGNADKFLTGGTTMNASAQADGPGDLNLVNSTFNNAGSFNINSDFDIKSNSGTTEVFNNTTGWILVYPGATSTISCKLVSSGILGSAGGILNITSDNSVLSGGTLNAPTIANVSGGEVHFNGNFTVSGTFACNIAKPFTFNGNITVPATATFNQNGTGTTGISWLGGTISGGTINNNYKLVFSGNTVKSITSNTINNTGTIINEGAGDIYMSQSTLNNTGSIEMQGTGNIYLSSTLLDNKVGGSVTIASNSSISFTQSVTELFNNAGTLIRSTATGTASVVCNFHNSGTINVSSGALNISGTKTLNGGNYFVSDGAFLNCSGTTTLSGALSGALNGPMNWSGNFNVTDSASVNMDGTAGLNWLGGFMNGGGTLANLGTVNYSGNADRYISSDTTLSNSGDINLSGTGDLVLSNSTLNNEISGVINLTADNDLTLSGSATDLLNNLGTINRTTSTGTTQINCRMTNSGTINVTTGTLAVGAAYQLNAGIYNVSSGASLNLQSTGTLSGILTGTLDGPMNISSNFNVPAAATVNFSGNAGLHWLLGFLGGGGTLTNQGTIRCSGNLDRYLTSNTTLSNLGTIILSGTGDLVLSNSTLNNEVSGVINLTADNDLTLSGSATDLLNNLGTINRTTSTGTAQINCRMTNSGTINVTSGTLAVGTAYQLNAGIYNVSSGAALNLQATGTLSGTLTGTLDGPMNINGNFNVPAAATVNFNGNAGLHWRSGFAGGGGTLTNLSTLHLSGTADKYLTTNTTLSNFGTIDFADACDLYLSSSTFNNEASGIIDLPSDDITIGFSQSAFHNLNNSGLIKKSGGSGSSSISATVNNNGTIDVQSGTLNCSQANFNNNASGTVAGTGTFVLPQPANLVNAGTFAPGGNPGILTAVGNFEMTPDAKLAVEIYGLASGTQYDKLAITGNAQFDGTVEVALGFAANINDTFTIATTTGTVTSFAMETTTSADYNGTTYTFSVSVTPDNKNLILTLVQKVLANESFNALDAQIALAPNPAQDFIVLRNNSGVKLTEAQLIDLNGRIITTVALDGVNQQIGLDRLAAGTYFLQIFSVDASVTKRFIKQ